MLVTLRDFLISAAMLIQSSPERWGVPEIQPEPALLPLNHAPQLVSDSLSLALNIPMSATVGAILARWPVL